MVLDLWSRVWLTPPAGRKMWAVALTHFSFLSVTWWVNSPCARASDSSLRKSSGRHGDKKKGSLHPQHSTTTGEPQWEQNPGLWQLRHAVISYDQLWQKKPRNLAEPLIARNSTTKTWTLIETVFRLPTKNAKPAVQKTRSERFATTKKKTSTKLWPPEHGWCLTCQTKCEKWRHQNYEYPKKCMPQNFIRLQMLQTRLLKVVSN